MDAQLVTLQTVGDVAVVTMDDGKVNALGYRLLSELRAVFAEAREQASAVVIAGRPGVLSAGFDLAEVTKGPREREAILREGGLLFLEILSCPRPVVCAATGHAIAGGVIFLLTADSSVGTASAARVGFNEVLIGVPLPEFAIALTQYRLSPRHAEAFLLADMRDMAGARDLGLIDQLVEPDRVVPAAIERAAELGARNAHAYGATKLAARGALLERFTGESALR